jgi:hypothetical protein
VHRRRASERGETAKRAWGDTHALGLLWRCLLLDLIVIIVIIFIIVLITDADL